MDNSAGNNLLFKLDNICYQSDGKQILADINIEIPPRKICLVTGPSGSGKSTLIKILADLITPSAGSILYKGESPHAYSPCNYRSKTVLVGQQPLILDGSVRDNLLLPFSLKAHKNKTVSDNYFLKLMELIGLEQGFIEKDGNKLSGGEKQKVALVRAAAVQPETMLLDEPSASLDISSEEKVIDFLINLKSEISLVTVAHSPAYLEIADIIIILKAGKVIKTAASLTSSELKKYLDDKDE